MNQLINRSQNLPTTIEDLSNFVLVGREKLVAVKAEIKAINKLNLAQEVRNQKREECAMLAEALLDAEVKVGDFSKQIPRAQGRRTDLTSMPQGTEVKLEHETIYHEEHSFVKPKHEVIAELGFTQKQVQQFETLASKKDLVEQVKAEARENDDIPTRTRVLELAKARSQKVQEKPIKEPEDYAEYCRYIDECKKISGRFLDFFLSCSLIEVDDRTFEMWTELLKDKKRIQQNLDTISETIPKLLKLQKFLNKELIK